jgi:hypothetical protein
VLVQGVESCDQEANDLRTEYCVYRCGIGAVVGGEFTLQLHAVDNEQQEEEEDGW